jgi:hypothetical protein
MFYIVLLFVASSVSYIAYTISPVFSINTVYLSLATFLFSIFNGFFIARQANRYNDIRNYISKSDANLTIIYRESTHVGGRFIKKIGGIILEYYEMRKKGWDDYINHRSTTIRDLHKAIDSEYKKNNESIHGEAMRKMLIALDDLQVQRKALITLHEERVTRYQYTIVILLALVLTAALLSVDTLGNIAESIVKAILVSVVGVVVWTLHQFDELRIFEGMVGEHSARDVLDIIEDKK